MPEIDPTYANGQTVYMIGRRLIVGARESMPQMYAQAEELYLVVYPQQVTPLLGAGPNTLTSGYQPQCNPCFHPALPAPFVYHDRAISGAPGTGKNGTAAALDAAEAAGNMSLPIDNAPGRNPEEVRTRSKRGTC